MRVLGISPLDKDATASFMEDGRVVFACGEERLSRVKLQDGFPAPGRAAGPGADRLGPAIDRRRRLRLLRRRRRGAADARGVRQRMRSATAPAAPPPSLEHCRRPCPATATPWTAPAPSPALADRAATSSCRASLAEAHGLHTVVGSSPGSTGRRTATSSRSGSTSPVADHHRCTQRAQRGPGRSTAWQGKLRRFHHHDTHAANAFFASASTRPCWSRSTATARATAAASISAGRTAFGCCTASPSPTRSASSTSR